MPLCEVREKSSPQMTGVFSVRNAGLGMASQVFMDAEMHNTESSSLNKIYRSFHCGWIYEPVFEVFVSCALFAGRIVPVEWSGGLCTYQCEALVSNCVLRVRCEGLTVSHTV